MCGLTYKPDRTATPGYGRSQAAKTTASYKTAPEEEKQQLTLFDVDKSGNDGIMKASQSGKRSEQGHYVVEDGWVDIGNSKAIAAELKKFTEDTADSNIEKCLVITKDGRKFVVHGDRYNVNTTLLGDDMKGSINIHNHVKGESQYSFSYEDLISSINDGSYISMACDEKFTYSMIFDTPISSDEAYTAYSQAKLEVDEALFTKTDNISQEDEQHERIKRACQKLGIIYKRSRSSA